jgi:Protein of unknown function (DUF1559)
MSNDSSSRRWFRTDLIACVAVILVMVGLLVPAVQSAREAARRMSCQNNLKQIGLSLHNYDDTYRALPAGWFAAHPADLSGAESWAWSVPLLPFTA